jgi:hypothetical protein
MILAEPIHLLLLQTSASIASNISRATIYLPCFEKPQATKSSNPLLFKGICSIRPTSTREKRTQRISSSHYSIIGSISSDTLVQNRKCAHTLQREKNSQTQTDKISFFQFCSLFACTFTSQPYATCTNWNYIIHGFELHSQFYTCNSAEDISNTQLVSRTPCIHTGMY